MKCTVNGAEQHVPEGTTVADVVATLTGGADPRGLAAAVNDEVIPRSRWADTAIGEAAAVEVVVAVQGG